MVFCHAKFTLIWVIRFLYMACLYSIYFLCPSSCLILVTLNHFPNINRSIPLSPPMHLLSFYLFLLCLHQVRVTMQYVSCVSSLFHWTLYFLGVSVFLKCVKIVILYSLVVFHYVQIPHFVFSSHQLMGILGASRI